MLKLSNISPEIKKTFGKKFIYSLKNKKIKVRGLLVNHETFGWEIIISDKSMILEIN